MVACPSASSFRLRFLNLGFASEHFNQAPYPSLKFLDTYFSKTPVDYSQCRTGSKDLLIGSGGDRGGNWGVKPPSQEVPMNP